MKYPQLVSSNAISSISDWLVYKLDELGVDAPIILVFSRFLLSLLANHADSLDVRREAVESLKQVSSSVDNKETKIAQLVDQLHSKLKKIEEETTLTASISFEPFSNRENFQQTQKEQTFVEEDPKKKYYMAFPALDKNGNSDDCVKTMPKSLNWSSIINIRSDKRHPIQTNKKLKSKRKRNFGRGKFESHKKNVSEPEPILWDMDFLGKGAWEMSADMYGDDFISKYNQVNKSTLEASKYDGHTNNQTTTNQNNLLEYNKRSEMSNVAAFSTMDMPRGGERDAYYDYDDEDDDEKRQKDRINDNDPFEISDSFCDSQNLKQLKSKFDSKVRALWDDLEDESEFRFHDSENIIQNLAISLQLLQNNNNSCGAGVSTSACGKNHFYNAEHRPEQTTHDFIKYGTNLNYSIWSDSVSVISANQSVWEQSGHDEKILCNDEDQPAIEWPDLCVMEVLHSIDVVATQPIYEHCGNSTTQLETTIEDSSMSDMATANKSVQIPLVEVTLPNHSASSRFSEVVPSFFREACSGQPVNQKSNVSKKPTDPNSLLQAHGAELESNDNLLTSEHTHFRPIKFPISPYIDGYSFRISNSPIKLEGVSRSETGSLYIDTKKYMEYKKTNADPHSDYSQKLHGTNQNVEEFFIKFQVKQNEKFCQTESEYSVYTQDNHANVPQSLHTDTDVGFWRMDNSELQQEPCINDPVNLNLKAETDLDGDEIMSDLSFIQNLYIGNDWNSNECVDAGLTNETTNDYYDHNYEYNIVYDLLKPETTKTLKKMLNQQVMLPNAATAWTMIPNDEPSNITMADDYRFMEDKLNRYNNSIRKQAAMANHDNAIAETCGIGRRKRRYSECRKDKLHYYESVKVLPFVQDSFALENFITCKFWTTNLTIFNPNENDNYSESLLIGLGNRPMTR